MTGPARTEHDPLGEVSLPVEALYGPQTHRAVGNFAISGRRCHRALILALLRVKFAAARANAEVGALTHAKSDLIRRAVTRILALPEIEWDQAFPLDPYQAGAGTSLHMNVNEVVANVANLLAGRALGSYEPIHPNDHVNRSQSTNDVFPTAMRLAILETSGSLLAELDLLAESFGRKGREWAAIPKCARTHLQDAVPMFLGQEFSAYATTVERSAGLFRESKTALRELGIGGTAAGTGLNAPPGYLAAMVEALRDATGEEVYPSRNLFEAMQSQAPVAHYSSALRFLALELTRVCNDLRLLSSGPLTGLDELTLPAVQPGSSIMPGKVNPSIPEMCNQVMYAVLGLDHTVSLAHQAGQLELNVMMPVMAHATLEATLLATRALGTLRVRCIEGMQPNELRLRRYSSITPQIATALTPKLGYELAAEVVKESVLTGETVAEVARRRNLFTEEELDRILRSATGRK